MDGDGPVLNGAAVGIEQAASDGSLVRERLQPQLGVAGVAVAVAAHPHLEVQVRPQGDARHAHPPQHVTDPHLLSDRHADFREVAVDTEDGLLQVGWVQLDDHQLAVEIGGRPVGLHAVVSGHDHFAIGHSQDGRACLVLDVHAVVEEVLTIAGAGVGVEAAGLLVVFRAEGAFQPIVVPTAQALFQGLVAGRDRGGRLDGRGGERRRRRCRGSRCRGRARCRGEGRRRGKSRGRSEGGARRRGAQELRLMDWLLAQDHQGDDDSRDQGQAYKDPIICILNSGRA